MYMLHCDRLLRSAVYVCKFNVVLVFISVLVNSSHMIIDLRKMLTCVKLPLIFNFLID